MTTEQVWDRIRALCEAQGFVTALSAFDFDQQPDGRLDRTYHLRSEQQPPEEYLCGQLNENHRFIVYLAIKIRRDGFGAARQLKVDMDLLEQAIAGDYPEYEYCVLDEPPVESEVQNPGTDQDYVVGRLSGLLTID